MKYLVMETHPAYAVVLDERGRFLKAANLHYQVGETVEDVVELRLPPARRRLRPAWLTGGRHLYLIRHRTRLVSTAARALQALVLERAEIR